MLSLARTRHTAEAERQTQHAASNSPNEKEEEHTNTTHTHDTRHHPSLEPGTGTRDGPTPAPALTTTHGETNVLKREALLAGSASAGDIYYTELFYTLEYRRCGHVCS